MSQVSPSETALFVAGLLRVHTSEIWAVSGGGSPTRGPRNLLSWNRTDVLQSGKHSWVEFQAAGWELKTQQI